jgi:hypothetical protein
MMRIKMKAHQILCFDESLNSYYPEYLFYIIESNQQYSCLSPSHFVYPFSIIIETYFLNNISKSLKINSNILNFDILIQIKVYFMNHIQAFQKVFHHIRVINYI